MLTLQSLVYILRVDFRSPEGGHPPHWWVLLLQITTGKALGDTAGEEEHNEGHCEEDGL